ncbi:MAG: substrate-binding protein [Hyphomicrobiales bacterium]|nr:substrate-binding protein [Hyphomicrobiales bacterium]
MNENPDLRRATVHDVAREAGVSLATVDRVLNGRPGVRPVTAEKVERAIAVLDFRRDLSASLLARSRDLRLRFIIPDGSNEFMVNLGAAIARRVRPAAGERMSIETSTYRALDAAALAASIDALEPKSCDCVVVVATEDDAVHRAIDAATRRGIAVMTLVSDLPGSSRKHFIGIDNIAAGRTAGSLLGRFCAAGGEIALIAGSLALRDHRERYEGFAGLLREEFPRLSLVGPFEGHDERAETEQLVAEVLDRHPNLVGLYNVGAGNAGLIAALQRSGKSGKVRVIAHELSETTRLGLMHGVIDVILDQNPDGEIRAAIEAARGLALGRENGESRDQHPEAIEIGIFLRDNLR